MRFSYSPGGQTEPYGMYLGTPDRQVICALGGIRPDTADLTLSLNNTAELSFTVDRYVDFYGSRIQSCGYDLLEDFMTLYVEHIGWFLLSSPKVSDDGKNSEYKEIRAESAEIELTSRDLVGFKVNCGTTDSIEMLAPDNTDLIDDVPFAKEQVKFCNRENESLSLLHMALKYAGMEGWSIGYVDEIPKVYRSYEEGVLVEKTVCLADEIGTFDIGSQSLYSFLTQDVEQFFECLILFDVKDMTINAWRPEHLGRDTNVTIGFSNLQNSCKITVDENSIFTRCRVAGDDDLGIGSVNFGSSQIENLSYFLNTRFLDEGLIAKYNAWRWDTESKRYDYIGQSRAYAGKLNVMTELKDRVPLDDCSTEWNKFSLEELTKAKDNYTAQLKGYETFYADENGDFDEELLAASPDAADYYQIRDVILPSIEIEFLNRDLPTSEGQQPYVDSYKTDWKLYGIDELLVNLDLYQSQKKGLEENHYDLPYQEYEALSVLEDTQEPPVNQPSYPPHTRDMHEDMHASYLDILVQLDATAAGSCAWAYEERTAEYEAVELEAEACLQNMNDLARSSQKEYWTMEGTEPFTKKELRVLSRLMRDTDYTNKNMFLTASDDQVTMIDEQLKLYDAAVLDLESTSQPQYTCQTSLDNFLALPEYRHYAGHLELGDFLYLGVHEDQIAKLRLISLSFNPLTMDSSLNLKFSNMIRTGSKRYDTTYLLGLGKGTSKNSISGSSHNSDKNEGLELTGGLIRKILASSVFHNSITNAVSQHFNAIIGQLVAAKSLESEMIRTIDLHAENGFFQYLQSQLIAADKIISDSGTIKSLTTLTANLQNAVMGTSSAETGIVVRLNAENASIEEAFIKQVLAQYISVNDLKAGTVNTDRMHIASEDGSLTILGNTQTFRDRDGHVRIQLGQDASGNFSFIVYDSTGNGILLDQDGIRESAVSDGLIQNRMIADGTIQSDKIDWSSASASTDSKGQPVWNAAQITLNDIGLDVQFSSVLQSLSGLESSMEGVQTTVDAVEKSIADKIWRTDFVSVTDSEGNTVSKSIVDLLVEHQVSLNGISASVKEVETATGTLTERISQAEQDADGFRQTVSANYTTKEEMSSLQSSFTQQEKAITQQVTDLSGNVSSLTTGLDQVTARVADAEGNVSALQTSTEGIQASVSDAKGNIATLQESALVLQNQLETADGRLSQVEQTADGLSSLITNKKDVTLSAFRYVRDWLGGSSQDTGNVWVECQVLRDNVNLAQDCTVTALDQNLNSIVADHLSAYTDGLLLLFGSDDNILPESYVSIDGGLKCLELDLGQLYTGIDTVHVWHAYHDSRCFHHRLEVSPDKTHWYALFDSEIQGGYPETEEGRVHYISESAIEKKMTFLNQNIDSIGMNVSNLESSVSSLKLEADRFDVAIESSSSQLANLVGDLAHLSEDVTSNRTEIEATLQGIVNRVVAVEDGMDRTSEIVQSADGWKALFAQIGMYDMPNIITNVLMSINGLEVSNPETGMRTVMKTDKFAGYYNDVEIFTFEKELTVTDRIQVKNGVDFTTLKYINRTYQTPGGSVDCLVHVKSGGNS